MNVKSKKLSIAARVLNEMYTRHAMQCHRWERQYVATSKCRYRGYFSLAAASVSGHYVADYVHSRVLQAWAIFPQEACSSSIMDDLRGVRHWRQAKKLAMRLRECHGSAWRPGHWLKVMPWRCA